MRDFLFSTKLYDGREVCVSPISADTFQDNAAYHLGDDSGYFIYEYDTRKADSGIEILAKTASYDAAIRIIEIFLSAQRAASNHLGGFLMDVPKQLQLVPLPAAT